MILVTGNHHKLEEFKRIMPNISWEALGDWELTHHGTQGPDIVEDADSFIGNAMIKARTGWQRTQKVSLADDSGLCVDALDGAPGIYSARYVPGSDIDRYQALLHNLKQIPSADRSAHFYCALAICGLDDQQRTSLGILPSTPTHREHEVLWIEDCLVVVGKCFGSISDRPSGSHGFGYDPIFKLADGRSFATVSGIEKDLHSHRGKALSALNQFILEKNIYFS